MNSNFFFSAKGLFVLVLVLAFSYGTDIYYGLYWLYPWLDIPLHFLGGLTVALAASLLFRDQLNKLKPLAVVLFIVGAAAIVGIGWEFFEWALDHTVRIGLKQGDLSDTLLDLAMDLSGALVLAVAFLVTDKNLTTQVRVR